MADRIVLSPDALRLLRAADVLTEAVTPRTADLDGWARDERAAAEVAVRVRR